MTSSGHRFRFRDWSVYKKARGLRKRVNESVKSFPPTEKYALADQTKRALNSLVLNIAEGANKTTDKDTRLYINRAHCSLDEVVSCLDCALDDEYISAREHEELLNEAGILASELNGFSYHLLKQSNNKKQ